MYVFLFAPLSSWTSSAWKRQFGVCGCNVEAPDTKVMTTKVPPTYLLVYRRVQSNDLSVRVCWRYDAARLGGSKGEKKRFNSVRQREKEKWDSNTIGGGVIQEQTHQLEEPRLVT
jgi:hypothetical protein